MAGLPNCIQNHTAMIYDRGGTRRLATLQDVSYVSYARQRNVTTDGEVVLLGRACDDQRATLNDIEPRRHELVLFRGTERVWEGPIMQTVGGTSAFKIQAHDVTEYLQGTALSMDWPGVNGGGPPLMTDRIAEIVEWELTEPYSMVVGTGSAAHTITVARWEGIDPPANVLPHLEVRPGNVLTFSDTIAFELTLFEHLLNLAESGVDLTTVGRRIVVWDSAEPLGRTPTLTEVDFDGEPEVILSGSDYTSVWHTSPQQREEGASSLVGNAGAVDPFYGAWTMVHTAEGEEGSSDSADQDTLNGQAQRGLLGRKPLPLIIRMPDSGLRLRDDLTLSMLVPGVEVPVIALLNQRRVSQVQILDKVTVTEDGSGEKVSVTLHPSGPAYAVARGGME